MMCSHDFGAVDVECPGCGGRKESTDLGECLECAARTKPCPERCSDDATTARIMSGDISTHCDVCRDTALVSEDTLCEWIKEHPEEWGALVGRRSALAEVRAVLETAGPDGLERWLNREAA